MLKTVICDLFGIRYPILQGGMAHIGTYELVSAVSNAGGLGIIGSGFYEPEWVRNQIRITKQHTNRPFGVNIQMASPHVRQIADIVIEEGVSIVTTGAGNPEPFIAEFKRREIKHPLPAPVLRPIIKWGFLFKNKRLQTISQRHYPVSRRVK